jgi:hypothetical protein
VRLSFSGGAKGKPRYLKSLPGIFWGRLFCGILFLIELRDYGFRIRQLEVIQKWLILLTTLTLAADETFA